GGPRTPTSERGLERWDPKVDISDDGTHVHVRVLQARGITGDGGFIELTPPRRLERSIAKETLVGQNELTVFIVRVGEDEPERESAGADDANPLQPAWVRDGLRIELGVRPEAEPDALPVGRVRRVAETQAFTLDAQFIPACASMLAHSALYAGWQQLQQELAFLTGAFGELHRRVALHVEQGARRGVDVRNDQDIGRFIERAVLAIDQCVYETIDAARAPVHVFQQVARCGRQLALALDLSAATREYLGMLSESVGSYSQVLEAERLALAADRELNIRSNLRLEVQRAATTVEGLRAVLHALEAKYLDYRINPSVDALRFLIDRDGEEFYTMIAAHAHQQMDGDLLTFMFPQLNLSGQHYYRLLILGDPDRRSRWEVGDELSTTLTLNPGLGGQKPVSRKVLCDTTAQRNLALDFATPVDLATISSLSLAVRPAGKVRGAILFQRVRGLASPVDRASPTPSGTSGGGGIPVERAPTPPSGGPNKPKIKWT
ncbi:MAG: hypothetical protein MUF00_12145, partial [Gemmatimonadaceae bacterium]|nr:hypothetical protein [Gemmatimonadaceae bacterium]